MAAKKTGKEQILAHFFDEGACSPLFSEGAVSAAFGCANGQTAYVICQNGSPVGVKDIDRTIRVLEMAAETGNPVVTFYDSTGAMLEGGLDLLTANSRLSAQIARISGVVPQIAVVTGTCAGSSAIHAAAADLCIVAKGAELFLTAPFNSEDKVADAGSAEFAARAGVAAVLADDALAAASLAAKLVGMLPGNNLAGPAVFDFAAPKSSLNLTKYVPARPPPRWPMRAAWWNCMPATARRSAPRWAPSTALLWALSPPARRAWITAAPPRPPVLCGCAMHTASPS